MEDTKVPFLPGTDESPLAGVSDYRGRPVYRSTSGGWRSALFVVVLEVASGFAFYGVQANLIMFLTGPLGHSNAAAAMAVNAWVGTASIMPLLGAFVADSWLGRYRSIILAFTLYVLGYGMMTLASVLPVQGIDGSSSHPCSLQVALFYTSLYLIALAQGADYPCALAFAADQFDANDPREHAARSSFFNWWYFCLAVGTTMALGGVGYIQESFGWAIGYGMLCTTVLCAAIVFLIGTSTYRLYTPTSGVNNPVTLLARSIVSWLVKETRQEEEAAAIAKEVEEGHSMLHLLSIWAACLSYGMVFAQIMTLFNKQGRTLDRHIIGCLELPSAALLLFGPATILVLVPFYDRVLVPLLRSMTANPSGLTLLQRLGSGIAMSLAAVSTAALVESRRLKVAREHGLVDVAGATVPMSWMWLLPQHVMMATASVFAEVGMQEFFYDQMPHEQRSLGLALYYSVLGIGNFISVFLISLIDRITRSAGGDSWFADNLNRAHLDYFYCLLAGLNAVGFALFLWRASSYAYNNNNNNNNNKMLC
ncbi:protein NRT1/ PTR FAMILY 5.10-like [Triticum urartu]|nr:protein NRT1/ PTR FAMILY 5.10-like [Triticum urartu]